MLATTASARGSSRPVVMNPRSIFSSSNGSPASSARLVWPVPKSSRLVRIPAAAQRAQQGSGPLGVGDQRGFGDLDGEQLRGDGVRGEQPGDLGEQRGVGEQPRGQVDRHRDPMAGGQPGRALA